MYRLDLAAKADRGLVRETNEDVARVVSPLRLALVADGMGGHEHGEVAAHAAADGLARAFERLGGPDSDIDETAKRLVRAFREANGQIAERIAAEAGITAMGTTLVAIVFLDDRIVVAHVGDSRCYRLRDGKLEQLTDDHSYAAELRRADPANPEGEEVAAQWEHVLTRCLNGEHAPEVDLHIADCIAGDTYLVCSDGLWGVTNRDTLADILRSAADARDACDRLIEAAWQAGGADNIGVAVARTVPHAPR